MTRRSKEKDMLEEVVATNASALFQHANEDVEKMILGNKCDMEDKRQVATGRGESVSVCTVV